jgi:glucokinase
MIMSDAGFAIGADIGGTHITAALIDLRNKTIIPSSIKRAGVNAAGSAEEILTAWSHCIIGSKGDKAIESICLAMPGPFDYEAGISLMRGQAKYESLYQLNIKDGLAKLLNCQAHFVYLDNDAACFLQGEVFNGAAEKYTDRTVIGVTLGTGLGSAVYKAATSKNADMWCWPFKEGIAEDYLCTRWFVKRWQELTGAPINGVKEMAQLPATNQQANEVFAEFGGNLADFLQDFIANESPAAIVIGGNIAKAFDRFGPILQSIIGSKFPRLKIEQAILGEEASLSGAVSSWLHKQKSMTTENHPDSYGGDHIHRS